MYATWKNYKEVTNNGVNFTVLSFKKPGLEGAIGDHDEWFWRSSPDTRVMANRVGLNGKHGEHYYAYGWYGARLCLKEMTRLRDMVYTLKSNK